MSPRTLLALVVAGALALAVPAARAADAPADSLGDFLKGLSDSTDTSYGSASVTFDTAGIDSLAANALIKPPKIGRQGSSLTWAPLLGYHRAEGFIAGAFAQMGSRKSGWLSLTGTYGFDNHQGRYAFDYRRVLLYRGPRRDRSLAFRSHIYEHATRLDLDLGYARASEPFVPEHSTRRLFNMSPVYNGHSSSSLYEQLGAYGSLTLWTGDWRFTGGVRNVVEHAMDLVSPWTLFGDQASLPPNVAAVRDDYTEPFGSVAFWRGDWELGALLEARGGGDERWWVRGALAKAFRMGPPVKTTLQFEYGATAANGPPQRKFGIGGPFMVSTLPIESGLGDHLLGGKMEAIEAHDLLRAIGLPHPDWLVVQPGLMADAGVTWNDPAGRSIVFSKPPGNLWYGSVGPGLVWRIGMPDPDVMARAYVMWPVGPGGGAAQYRFAIGRTFSFLGAL